MLVVVTVLGVIGYRREMLVNEDDRRTALAATRVTESNRQAREPTYTPRSISLHIRVQRRRTSRLWSRLDLWDHGCVTGP